MSGFTRHGHPTGLTRREWLQVGYSGLLGVGLTGLLPHQSRAAKQKGRRAKSVVLIFLTGAPSHIDTFDMKPDAPDEVRGEFKPIATSISGIQICEHLPRLASLANKYALVRSFAHREYNHLLATHEVLTGTPIPGGKFDQVASRNDWPCFASALDYLRPRDDGVPNGVTLPTFLVEGPLTWPGQHAGFLGAKHDPWHVKQDPNRPGFRFESLALPEGFGVERLRDRRSLLDAVNQQQGRFGLFAERSDLPNQQRQAFSVLTSGRVAKAFDLEREAPTIRDRYGRHMYGQSLLLARRLVEAGVPMIQVNMGIVQTFDNHADIFHTLKSRLLPPLDMGVSALLEDLSASGLLDETLVLMLGEFGRTPKISTVPGNARAGRDHWARAFFAMFAGAGVRGGQVIGRTDKVGSDPLTPPYSPADFAATVYNSLGVDHDREIRDSLGRPVRLCTGTALDAIYT